MTRIFLLLVLAINTMLFSAVILAGVEKWVGPDGRVHYSDKPPEGVGATPVDIRHNVIETGPVVLPVRMPKPAVQRNRSPEQVRAGVRPELQAYIEHCRNNRGVDCELEARQMIDGPAPVIFPGDPLVFPRPDVRPPPPGLPLKYSITQ